MSDRLPTHIAVGALLRRVNDAGGIAMVRAKGDAQGGAILVLIESRSGPVRVLERTIGFDGSVTLTESTPADGAESYWRRRRERDPDLWVVELDIPEAERFAAETISAN
ncbi:DUF1491 family protein [Sphingomonas sp. A2-49]|uniref:DUF1491 family protein n=1 Tax=Sphingomonas sp. A2-49 TaxID=1391375 RepID=UPI0021CEFE0E|nr:DUF1491 family protein [Sphingomonas sp. A2-49]MCU6454197.1 DUF1491 family protein [Sphingomonas sp. A2-49]